MTIDRDRVQALTWELLAAIGEDPDREGLVDTPRRVADWWAEFVDYEPGRIETLFQSGQYDQMVVVRGVEVWSLCEHHLLPFSATVTVGYIPEAGHVLGLSKIARVVFRAAHRLQIQERMVAEVADDIEKLAQSGSVAVVAYGDHLCMRMRGVRAAGQLRTSVLRGAFRDRPEARLEFLTLADGGLA